MLQEGLENLNVFLPFDDVEKSNSVANVLSQREKGLDRGWNDGLPATLYFLRLRW